jgi:hypothetical protein
LYRSHYPTDISKKPVSRVNWRLVRGFTAIGDENGNDKAVDTDDTGHDDGNNVFDD